MRGAAPAELGGDTGREHAPRAELGVVVGDERVPASWAAAPAAKRGASSRATPTQSVRAGTVAEAVREIAMIAPPEPAPACTGRRHAPTFAGGGAAAKTKKWTCPGPRGVPTVGAMKGYGQFCPVAVAAEVFAERWTPLILRELFAGERRFNDIRRGVPLISRSLLAARLRELQDAGVLESRPVSSGRGREYRLTRAGEGLREVVDGLGAWGQRWVSGQFGPQNLDVSVLMWNVRRRINRSRLPARRVIVRFDFRALPLQHRGMRTWWLILERPEVDLCLKDPGFDVDIVVSAEAAAMARIWMGQLDFAQALRAGNLRVEGPRPLVQALPGWLLLSHYAHVERPAPAG